MCKILYVWAFFFLEKELIDLKGVANPETVKNHSLFFSLLLLKYSLGATTVV